MPQSPAQRFEKFPGLRKCIDFPRPDEAVYDECIPIAGWLHAEARDPARCHVRAWLDGRLVGETGILFPRPDVSEFLSITPDLGTGFRLLARVPQSGDALLQLTVSWEGEDAEFLLGKVSVRLLPAALQNRPYGEVVFPENETLLHRENIYGSGPPIEEPGIEVLDLLRAYLPARSSVVDVGCGAGAYGPPLIAAGHEWLGLEANPHCCDILIRRELPFRRVDLESERLPCADAEYDDAVCIEVLEHTKNPESFAGEIARIIRRRALFSVPNMELLPYLHDWRVAPWHLLEGDHKNFFTRASLGALLSRFFRRVEVFPYGEHPLRTRDDVRLYVHLFAVADK